MITSRNAPARNAIGFPRRNMTDLGPVAHGVAAGPTVDVEHDAVEALVPTGANLDQRAVDVRLSTFASDP